MLGIAALRGTAKPTTVRRGSPDSGPWGSLGSARVASLSAAQRALAECRLCPAPHGLGSVGQCVRGGRPASAQGRQAAWWLQRGRIFFVCGGGDGGEIVLFDAMTRFHAQNIGWHVEPYHTRNGRLSTPASPRVRLAVGRHGSCSSASRMLSQSSLESPASRALEAVMARTWAGVRTATSLSTPTRCARP